MPELAGDGDGYQSRPVRVYKKGDTVDIYDAVMTLETDDGAQCEEDEIRALQALVNSGTWGLQGSIGRAMMDAIEAGYVALGPTPARDYWGGRIPSRSEVVEGTKGSVSFVEASSPYGVLD